MNAGVLPLRNLFRSGPVVPVVPASASVWQAPQPPAPVNVCLPSAAGSAVVAPPPPVEVWAPPPFCAFSQVENSAGVTTLTVERIVEWPRPQSSAHTTG